MRGAVVFASMVACIAAAATGPAVFWSPSTNAAIAAAGKSNAFTWDNLRTMVRDVCGANAANPVEAFVIFSLEQFSTADFNAAVLPFSENSNGGVLSSVLSGVAASESSAVLPYATLDGERLSTRLSRFASTSGVSVMQNILYNDVSKNSVAMNALHNDQCDVIIVALNRPFSAGDENVISKSIEVVARETAGSYAFGIVGQSHAEDVSNHHAQRMLLNGSKKFVYMTPDIFTGLLVGLLMAVTALIGLCCLHQVQTPTTFCHQPLPQGKEF